MPTLSEYANLTNTDDLTRGVYKTLLTTDALMAMLAFKSFEGTAFAWNEESTHPTTTSFAVGSTWQDSEPTFTRRTTNLAIVGVQSPLDRYAMQTRSSVQSQKAVLLEQMSRSLARKIGQYVIKGDSAVTSTEFDGLDRYCRTRTRMMAMDDGVIDGPGAAETELTLDRLDAAVDQVDDGATKPDALVMNTTMRRKLTSLSRASGSGVVLDSINLFGHKVTTYDGIPILLSNWITNEETYADASTWASSTATTIFAVKFGQEKDGFTLIHNGSVLNPDVQDVGIKENKNENLYRMVVYLGSVVFSPKQIIALGGIDSAA